MYQEPHKLWLTNKPEIDIIQQKKAKKKNIIYECVKMGDYKWNKKQIIKNINIMK